MVKIEEQEKILAQSWQENPKESSEWKSAQTLTLKRNEVEIHCPPALTAWRELKNKLAPESFILFTNQEWVWEDYYGLDLEETGIQTIPLPYLGPLNMANFQNYDFRQVIQEKMERLLQTLEASEQEKAKDDFLKALSKLKLPSEGQYQLILPPLQFSLQESLVHFNKMRSDPLILLKSSLI